MSAFRIATRDELWSHGRLVESRLSHGQAIEDDFGIVATDAREDALVEICERELERLREAMPRDARVRLVAEASTDGVSATMTIRRGELSIVTTAENAAADDALCHPEHERGTRGAGGALIVPTRPPGPSLTLGMTGQPILWKNGTAAVLLHEAFGHPAEHGHPPIAWPAWLHVELGLRQRRATFRDVPLTRMSHVLVTQTDAPFEVPEDAIEVELIAGGHYEPLTEIVTLQMAVPRFELRATRQQIAQSLAGACGDPIRYPGVICSREGQELFVPSFAPLMVTR